MPSQWKTLAFLASSPFLPSRCAIILSSFMLTVSTAITKAFWFLPTSWPPLHSTLMTQVIASPQTLSFSTISPLPTPLYLNYIWSPHLTMTLLLSVCLFNCPALRSTHTHTHTHTLSLSLSHTHTHTHYNASFASGHFHLGKDKNNFSNNLKLIHPFSWPPFTYKSLFGVPNHLLPLCHITWQLGKYIHDQPQMGPPQCCIKSGQSLNY